jgi:hypothetical protein
MRLNQFLKIEAPKDAELYGLVKGIEDFEVLVNQGSLNVKHETLPETALHVIDAIAKSRGLYSPIESGLRAVLSYNVEMQAVRKEEGLRVEEVVSAVNLFMTADVSKGFDHFLLDQDQLGPLLDEIKLRRDLEYMHALVSGSRGDAQKFSDELISDIKAATHYSHDDSEQGPSAREFAVLINMLTDQINSIDREEE